jgi:phasin family protein
MTSIHLIRRFRKKAGVAFGLTMPAKLLFWFQCSVALQAKETLMAKKPETQSVFDMFSQFGHDLKMPDVDVDAILNHHRKNLEALEKSAKASAAGASSVMSRQREMLQRTFQEITEMAQSYRAPGNPQELMTRQAEFARKSFEAAVKDAGEVSELVKKSSTDSIEILRARIRESMEEIRQSYEKRK